MRGWLFLLFSILTSHLPNHFLVGGGWNCFSCGLEKGFTELFVLFFFFLSILLSIVLFVIYLFLPKGFCRCNWWWEGERVCQGRNPITFADAHDDFLFPKTFSPFAFLFTFFIPFFSNQILEQWSQRQPHLLFLGKWQGFVWPNSVLLVYQIWPSFRRPTVKLIDFSKHNLTFFVYSFDSMSSFTISIKF